MQCFPTKRAPSTTNTGLQIGFFGLGAKCFHFQFMLSLAPIKFYWPPSLDITEGVGVMSRVTSCDLPRRINPPVENYFSRSGCYIKREE